VNVERSPHSSPAARGVDRQTLAQFVAGDRDAFDRVFAALRDDVVWMVRRHFYRPADQEEAFQEAWLQIFRVRHRVDVNRHKELRAWARTVAKNRCLDLLKARRRRPEVPVAEVSPCPGDRDDAEVEERRARLRRTLDRFVECLGSEERRFFRLCFAEEFTHEELARRLDITVRQSKYRKKKLLARMLGNAELRDAAGVT